MAPILSFVKIQKHLTLPVRLHISLQKQQRQNQFFQSAINIQNNTRLINLIKTNKVYLSNTQIREILTVFKDDLIKILIVESIEILRLKSEKGSGTRVSNAQGKDLIRIVISREAWKIQVSFTLKWLEQLRTGDYENVEDIIVRVPLENDKSNDKSSDDEVENVAIPQEDEEIAIPGSDEEVVEVVEVPEEEEEVKFHQKYEYKRNRLFNKPLEIEVLAVPMRR